MILFLVCLSFTGHVCTRLTIIAYRAAPSFSKEYACTKLGWILQFRALKILPKLSGFAWLPQRHEADQSQVK